MALASLVEGDGMDLVECLRLLDKADRLLIDGSEWLLSAHLQAVIEPIRSQLAGAEIVEAAARGGVDAATSSVAR